MQNGGDPVDLLSGERWRVPHNLLYVLSEQNGR